jgi:hypothetical protein
MKKIYLLLVVLASVAQTQAQFVNQLIFKKAFTPHEVDSVITAAVGIPGVFPTTYGARAYKVIYNTVNGDSTPTIASGLLIVPVGAPCKSPMMSYQHGTVTKKNDVPSRFAGEWFIALAAASKGYVSLMPDYVGLGDGPGMHPYQHAQSAATCVIDLIRAAKEVVDTMGAPVNEQLFLFGYSQGGHATMAAHQMIQEKFDNTMHVTASAPMSGAYDMSGTMSDVMVSDSAYPSPYYLPYLLLGFNSVYHLFTNNSDVFRAPYDSILPPLYDGTHSGGQIDNVMPNVPKLVMQQNQIDSFVNYPQTNFFREKLRESDSYNWTPNSPIRMYYCQGDKSVSYHNAQVAYQHFIQNGATMVDTVDVDPNLDHYPCAQFAILSAVYWFDTLTFKPLAATTSAVNATSTNTPNGSVTVNPSFGDTPYTFSWSTGATTATINELGPGTYYVTITDQSLCTYTDSATVQLINGLQNQVLSNVRVYPNPSTGKVIIENTDLNDVLLQPEAFDMNGRAVKTYTVKQANTLQVYFEDAMQGVYFLHLKAQSGKEVWRKVTLL